MKDTFEVTSVVDGAPDRMRCSTIRAHVFQNLGDGTRVPILALAELPLAIRGFGPVKAANAEKAAVRRARLFSLIPAGGNPVAQAAK